MSEFDLIRRYFNWPQQDQTIDQALIVGNGDDAAVVSLTPDEALVVSVDTSIAGVHFPEDTPAYAIGHKSLAVNLSDMAAMGAKPRWFTLALTLPEADHVWLQGFSSGLRKLANMHKVSLIGGDTTRGPLSITIQIMGTVPKNNAALRRNGAKSGDLICVTGTLGDAAAGLACIQNRLTIPHIAQDYCIERLNCPSPRITFGEKLRDYAHSCIDVSDGLLADLQHILDQSKVSATLRPENLPFSSALNTLPVEQKTELAMTGGDDYELLFSLPADHLNIAQAAAVDTQTPITVIGQIETLTGRQPELNLTSGNTLAHKITHKGFNHFQDHSNTP